MQEATVCQKWNEDGGFDDVTHKFGGEILQNGLWEKWKQI